MEHDKNSPSWPSGLITAVIALVITAGLGVGIGFIAIHKTNGPTANVQAAASTSSSSSAGSTSASTSTSASSSAAGGTSASAELTAGKSVFVENCGGCHTLAEAGSAGNASAPNLDTLKPSDATVTHQVINGGGAMPAFGNSHLLTTAQITDVAKYVSTVAGTMK